MQPRVLRSFVVLAEELNFSRAAERLHVAQPALSQQIRRLERELGAELVDRTQRPLRLTEAGSYLLVEARELLSSSERAALITREIGAGIRGWLGVGFTRSSMYSVLPTALQTFHQAYPRVELELHEMVTEEQPEALEQGRIHIGIGRQPAELAGRTTRLLLREQVMVVLSPDDPSAGGTAVDIGDLAQTPLILYPKHPTARFAGFIESFYRSVGLVPPVAYRTFEIQTAIGLVAAGLGVTFVGASVAHHGRTDVVYRPVAGLANGEDVSTLAATYPTGTGSPHLLAFLDCLPDLGETITPGE